MLKEGIYFKSLNDYVSAFCVFKLYDDKSHTLKIFSNDIHTGETKSIDLHSSDEVKNLYQFLKKHFEFTHEEYLIYVSDMKAEGLSENDIVSEEQWRAEMESEFGGELDG